MKEAKASQSSQGFSKKVVFTSSTSSFFFLEPSWKHSPVTGEPNISSSGCGLMTQRSWDMRAARAIKLLFFPHKYFAVVRSHLYRKDKNRLEKDSRQSLLSS